MTLVVALLFAWLAVCVVREIRADGYGRRPPPRSHPDDGEQP